MSSTNDKLAREVQALLDEWVDATIERDAERYALLFATEPEPIVVWPSGEVVRGYDAVADHLKREIYHAKSVVQRVDLFDLEVAELTENVWHAAFRYDVHASDLWGTSLTVRRLASMTFVWMREGLRIVNAHFGPAQAPRRPSSL